MNMNEWYLLPKNKNILTIKMNEITTQLYI